MNVRDLKTILLGVWLTATGLLSLLGLTDPFFSTILALLALVTGVLILWDLSKVKFRQSIGMALLGVWLILTGILSFVRIGFSGLGVVMALLAAAAGILILLRR